MWRGLLANATGVMPHVLTFVTGIARGLMLSYIGPTVNYQINKLTEQGIYIYEQEHLFTEQEQFAIIANCARAAAKAYREMLQKR